MELSDMLKEAHKAGACGEAIRECATCETFEQALGHPKAAEWMHWYAFNIIKGRFPEAEETLSKDAQWAYKYARDVIKGRFPEGEAAINKDAELAIWYARDVLGTPLSDQNHA